MREVSPRIGRLLLAALRITPRRVAWPEWGRLGLDPRGSTVIATRWGPVAWFEN